MAKIVKHAEFLDALHGMITKEGTAGKVTGVPGKDTDVRSVSKETEHVDKNKEGHPEKNPQEFKQEKGHDDANIKGTKKAEEATPAAEPTKVAEVAPQATSTATTPVAPAAPNAVVQKAAEDVHTNTKLAQLGQQLLDTINEMNKQATAGVVTGVPGKDTDPRSVSKETEHVDKNKEGHPEKNPQEFKQEKGHDDANIKSHGSVTSHKHAEELDLDKEASFELGRQFARAFLSNKTAAESNIYKEAGRRDFETLIAQASAELEADGSRTMHDGLFKAKGKKAPAMQSEEAVKVAEEQAETLQIKQAEEAGAQAFYTLLKQAQEEEKLNQTKTAFEQQLNKLASEKQAAEAKAAALAAKLADKEAEMQKQAEEAKLDAKFASWGNAVVDQVIARLKQTPAT